MDKQQKAAAEPRNNLSGGARPGAAAARRDVASDVHCESKGMVPLTNVDPAPNGAEPVSRTVATLHRFEMAPKMRKPLGHDRRRDERG